jgi:hypothetical protein
MKTYVMTTGAIFGLITLSHLLRVVEGRATRRHRSLLRAPDRSRRGAVGLGVSAAAGHPLMKSRA